MTNVIFNLISLHEVEEKSNSGCYLNALNNLHMSYVHFWLFFIDRYVVDSLFFRTYF